MHIRERLLQEFLKQLGIRAGDDVYLTLMDVDVDRELPFARRRARFVGIQGARATWRHSGLPWRLSQDHLSERRHIAISVCPYEHGGPCYSTTSQWGGETYYVGPGDSIDPDNIVAISV